MSARTTPENMPSKSKLSLGFQKLRPSLAIHLSFSFEAICAANVQGFGSSSGIEQTKYKTAANVPHPCKNFRR
jgi:hypothetical protein